MNWSGIITAILTIICSVSLVLFAIELYKYIAENFKNWNKGEDEDEK